MSAPEPKWKRGIRAASTDVLLLLPHLHSTPAPGKKGERTARWKGVRGKRERERKEEILALLLPKGSSLGLGGLSAFALLIGEEGEEQEMEEGERLLMAPLSQISLFPPLSSLSLCGGPTDIRMAHWPCQKSFLRLLRWISFFCLFDLEAVA